MIVRTEGQELVFITQPDHAALAAALMAAWRGDGFLASPRREDVLLAVREHDNGWREEDAAPLVDEATGRPLDFMNAPDFVRWRLWPRGVAALEARPYAAALVAHHAVQIHEVNRDAAAWEPFFATMETLRDRCLSRSPFGTGELSLDYFFVRVGDLMSLAACTGWPGPLHDGGYELRVSGERLQVLPDPFDGREVRCAVRARRLPNRPFSGTQDLLAALAGSEPRPMTVVASAS